MKKRSLILVIGFGLFLVAVICFLQGKMNVQTFIASTVPSLAIVSTGFKFMTDVLAKLSKADSWIGFTQVVDTIGKVKDLFKKDEKAKKENKEVAQCATKTEEKPAGQREFDVYKEIRIGNAKDIIIRTNEGQVIEIHDAQDFVIKK